MARDLSSQNSAAGGGATDAHGPSKRMKLSIDPETRTNAGFTSAQYKFACSTIRVLKKNKHAAPFTVPVDPVALGIPHYTTIIKRPMDLATIERKLFSTTPTQLGGPDNALSKDGYSTVDEWIADVRLIFQNCYTFNGPDHPISQFGKKVEEAFEKQLKRLPSADAEDNQSPASATSGFPSNPLKPGTSRRESLAGSPSAGTDVNDSPNEPHRLSTTSDPGVTEQLKYCSKILDHLYKKEFQEFAWFFYDPVDPAIIPTYHTIIKSPMDLSTMRKKLDSGAYTDAAGFYADFQQIVKNCNTFNPPGSVAQGSVKRLKEQFDKKWKGLPKIKAPALTNRTSSTLTAPTPKQKSIQDTVVAGSTPPPTTTTASPANPSTSHHSPSIPMTTTPAPTPAPPPLLPPISISVTPSPAPTPKKMTAPAASPSSLAPSHALLPLDTREQAQLSAAIHSLKGQDLERAIAMLKNGVSGIQRFENETGDEEYEICQLPIQLSRSLYDAFVVKRATRRNAGPSGLKRTRDAMEFGDSD
ncbi:hypothetical protein FRC02_009873 [Tulasnella sp. 418]|nr:hypothetical protein FRC02_009873 [Tulasnella sp. 418]